MIVKKLRTKNNWSQEQLAAISGVSLRTIQRVEAGNRASLETLKSLASVFEVEISQLMEEIIVIDKEANTWQTEPLWVKLGVIGIKKRSHLLSIEYAMIIGAVLLWWFYPLKISTPLAFFGAYTSSKILAYIDKKDYW